MNSPAKPAKGIQSLETGFRILSAIQQGPGAIALKDIAERTGLVPSAAHNYLTSLVRIGAVIAQARGHYRLGPTLASLGLSAAKDVDYFEVVRSAAIDLSESLNLACAVMVWNVAGPLILFNKADVGNQIFALRNGLIPISTTAGGHVFAAYLPVEATLPLLKEELNTGEATCREWLQSNARLVEANGFAKATLAALTDYGAISAPIWDGSDRVAYALSLSSPGLLEKEDLDDVVVPALLERTRELSRALGAPSSRWASRKGMG